MALLGPPLPWVPQLSRRGVYTITRWRGQLRLASWPRKRKHRRSARQLQLERDFAAAVLAIKWLDPEIVTGAIDTFRGSGALWRDQLMAQLYGTAWTLKLADGRELMPTQFYRKVSASLDQLGAQTGALLVRAPGVWRTLAPGAPGLRFTSQGENLPPEWA